MIKSILQKFSFIAASVLAISGLTLNAQAPAVGISLNNTGLASITYNGTNFLSYGDLRLNQVEFQNSDGTVSGGSTSNTVTVDLTHQIQTRTYAWGTIAESYTTAGNRLSVSVTVSNQSSLPIKGIWFEPFGLQFPSTIAEFAQGYPLMRNTLGQPAFQTLTFTTGAATLVADDVAKPLLLGYPNPVSSPNATLPIALVTDRVSNFCGCFPTINRPIPAHATDTFNFSLRFGPTGSTDTTLAPDVFQAFAAAFPSTLPVWPDHRAIGSVHLSTNTMGLSGWSTNPRGYLMDPSVDVTTPAGVAAFQQRMLQSANSDISVLQKMNAQGVIAWDLEGEQFGPYNGDPTQLATLAPEMDPIADQYIQRFTDAGFRVGVTIRPQQLVIAPGLTSAQQNFVTDPTPILLSKAQYAHNRWGATLFYVDSNVNSGTDPNPIDPTIFKTLQAALPDSLFFPEHWETQYWAYSAPYGELQGGFTSTPAIDRFTYPNAFSMIYTADGDLQDNFQQLVTAVSNGDILLYRSWFDDEPAGQQIQSIYKAAGVTTTSVTISINPPGTAVALGQPQQFATTIAGSTNQQVTWSMVPTGVGSISSSGVYTAPAVMPSQQTINLRAVSAADPTKIATTSVSFLPSVSVAISIYQQGTSVTAGQTEQFNASVIGTSNQQVSWSLLSGPGSMSSYGLYTAPLFISTQQTATVQATSGADPTRSSTTTITLLPSAGVTLSPSTTSLSAGQTQQFTATVTGSSNQQVTWTVLAGGGGTISATGFYSAPSTIAAQLTVMIKATSTADSTKTATASITLTPTVSAPSGLLFVPMTPCRIADTRNTTGQFGGPILAGGSTRAFPIRNSGCGVPANAIAYSMNITAVPSATLSYLTAWPYGSAQPLVGTLNSDGRIKANAAILLAGSDTAGSVSIFVSDSTQFILDIDGYFVPPGTSQTGFEFYPLAPCRVADTRLANGPLGGPFIPAGTARSFPVASACSIPAAATAYSLNFTAIPHKSLGYITAWPEGQSQPNASVLNSVTGTPMANAAIIPAGTPSRGVSVFASDDTDVAIDINGYFAPPSTNGLSLYPVTPCRVLDTRGSSGSFSGTLPVDVQGSACSLNASAQAYVLNAGVLPSGPLPYLTLWPDAQSQPFVSSLNAFDGASVSNMAVVPTTNGKIDAFAGTATQLILDISAYFAP